MKNFLIFLAMVLWPLTAAAQEQTLFDSGVRVGGFGSPIFEFSNIAGDFGTTNGGGGGLVMNDFFIGGYGMGSTFGRVELSQQVYRVNIGYAGLWFGYTPAGIRLFHPYFSSRVGWGSVELTQGENDESMTDPDRIFVLAPEAGIELNIFRWFRLSGAVGYRWVEGVDPESTQMTNKDFRSVTGSLTLRFGGFGYGKKDQE